MSPAPDSTFDDPKQVIADLERKLAERTAERDEAESQKAAIAEILGVINSSPGDLAPVFDAILEKAHAVCGAATGSLQIYDGESICAVTTRGLPDSFANLLRERRQSGRISGMRAAFLQGTPYFQISDLSDTVQTEGDPTLAAHAEVAKWAKEAHEITGVRTHLYVPLRKDGELLGVIVAGRLEVRPFSDKQIALLENFAAQAVIAMENARLITETREALEQQTATSEVLQVINSSPGDLTPVFETMLEKATGLCEAAFGVLRTWNGNHFHFAAAYGHQRLTEWARTRPPIAPGDGPLVRIVGGEAVVRIVDAPSEYETAPGFREMVEISGMRSAITVALRKEDTLVGSLTVYRQEVRPFTEKQVTLLQNFAAQAVIAMENARLITETREALEQQTATAEVLGVINSSPGDLAPVFDAMLDKATSLCEAAFGVLWIIDGERIRAVATHNVPSSYRHFLEKETASSPGPSSGVAQTIRAKSPLLFADAAAGDAYQSGDPFAVAAVELGGVRTLLNAPLVKDDAVLGILAVYRKEVRPFTDKQIALLQNFAAQAVIAMENARLITETREALEQQTATAEVLGVINSSPGDLAPVFDAMLDKAMRLCGFDYGSLQTYDGQVFRAVAVRVPSSPFGDLMRQPFKPDLLHGEAPLARLMNGAPYVQFADMAELLAQGHNDIRTRSAVELGGIRTALFVPLRTEGALLGYISALRKEVRPFSDKQIALLQNFAAQAVIAMENARLLGETREALEQQTATAEVLQVINSSPGDLAPVFDAILEKAHTLCGAAHGALMTYDGEHFRAVALHEMPEQFGELLSHPFRPPAGGPTERLLRGERIIHIPDVATRESTTPNARASVDAGIRTLLMVPLRKDTDLLGYITAHRMEVRPFSEREIALLENFAAQAVIAMENARLLGELRQRTDEVGELNRGLEARVAEQVDELGRVGRLKRFLAPQLAELIVSQGDEKILESHRREIVVVFCDLRGYTAFTETAEPEEVLEFLRQYHGALGPLVSQFEGTLDQFSGDGIMVFFNDPVPCADPAERAVKMAVAMRSAANTLIADWRERGRDLGFGAGIAQGYATLGQIGFSERSGYTAIGTVCNVAARLCAEAKDGQILLGQLVNVALKGSVATEQLGPLVLKGLSQPVVAYNVPLGAIQPALRVIEGGSPETV